MFIDELTDDLLCDNRVLNKCLTNTVTRSFNHTRPGSERQLWEEEVKKAALNFLWSGGFFYFIKAPSEFVISWSHSRLDSVAGLKYSC